jgi:SPP1 gp7 family putative phage head morphogenesis protein
VEEEEMNQREKNQQRMDYEGVIQYQLNNIIELIKDRGLTDVSKCQGDYGQAVDNILRKGATQAYDLGSDYVDEVKGFFGVTTDEISKEGEIVNNLCTIYGIKFWRKIATLLGRNDILLQKYDYEPRSPLNSNYMATSTAIGLITRAMALGTINKARLLQSKLRGAAEQDDTVDQYVWSSVMDNNTCDTCAELDGEYFDVDDPDMPEPGEACEGGDNCRCTLEFEPATDDTGFSELDQFDTDIGF